MARKGMTLIELIIAIMLVAILAGALTLPLITQLKVWVSGMNRSNLIQGSSIALQTMSRYISQAVSITAATAGAITFTADINDDSIDETVTFDTSGTNLQKTIDASTAVLAPNAQTLSFVYRNASDVAFVPANQTDRDAIRVITVTLTMSLANETLTESTSVRCRNRN